MKKRHIVVIENVRIWARWGGAILPKYVVRQVSKFVLIRFEYHKDLSGVKCLSTQHYLLPCEPVSIWQAFLHDAKACSNSWKNMPHLWLINLQISQSPIHSFFIIYFLWVSCLIPFFQISSNSYWILFSNKQIVADHFFWISTQNIR